MVTRKSVTIVTVLFLSFTVVIALLLTRPAFSSQPNSSVDAMQIETAIRQSVRVDLEAGYTLDANQLATVYVNDPRGGPMPPEAFAQIQEVRQDPSLRVDQVGYLDYKQSVIEWRKLNWGKYLTELRARQKAGTLTGDDLAVLAVVDGTPAKLITATAEPAQTALPPVKQLLPVGYPIATLAPFPISGYPGGLPEKTPQSAAALARPTAVPVVQTAAIVLPFHLPDPATLPPASFQIDILSVDVQGDIAKAVVHVPAVTSEMVLVKLSGGWYIAGGRLLKLEP